jgi:hypothetical protein
MWVALHHTCRLRLSARTHVQRLRGQQHGVDADHRSSPRIQAAQCAAACSGHVTLTHVPGRCTSITLSGFGVARATGKNEAVWV